MKELLQAYREKHYVKISPSEWQRRRDERELRRISEIEGRAVDRQIKRLLDRATPTRKIFRCPLVKTISGWKQCTKCLAFKPLNEFPNDPRTADKCCSNCKTCKGRSELEWRKRNRERLAEKARARFANNPHTKAAGAVRRSRYRARIRKVESDFTVIQWQAIKDAYNHRCAYCGEKKPLTQDHVIPISKGGPHVASNIVPACKSCNSRKQDREPLAPFQRHLII